MAYIRSTLPDKESLLDWLSKEFEAVEQALALHDVVKLKELHSPPVRLQTGQIVLADGTDWNPGSGAGIYGYYAGSWHKLG
jgi:hypothetical protein